MKNMIVQTVYYSWLDFNNRSIYIAATDNGICFIGSEDRGINELKNWLDYHIPNAKQIEDSDKIVNYVDQIRTYLQGNRTTFSLSLDLIGTDFQQKVWRQLQTIPYGITSSYTKIAEKIGNPKATRAVGTAIGTNPVLIIIPCHRVISKNGKIGGYRGGIQMKERLLELESGT